jgi:hypothetical protein
VVWGTGDFTGGTAVFGADMKRETDTTDAIHVTGTVEGYGRGFLLWFSNCSSLSAFSGVSFKLSGSAGVANTIEFQLQTNSDYPWQADLKVKKGGCTAPDACMAWNACLAPSKTVSIPASQKGVSVSVTWAEVSGGTPVTWNPASSPGEILGIQWQFPWFEGLEYEVDVTVDDVTLLGGIQGPCGDGTSGASV